MNPALCAVRIGLGRGWTEFRHSLGRVDEYVFTLMTSGIILVVLYFQRDNAIAGTSLPLATLALPGVIGGLVAFNTLTAAAFTLSFEREDGTLLRAKAAPFGVVGYLSGQVVRIPLSTVMQVLILLVPGLFLFDGLTGTAPAGWLTFGWVLALGLLATLPIGLLLGGLTINPRITAQIVGVGSAVLIAVSGIFYPISALPIWLHPIAELFPFYWLGLGMRSALLPDAAAAVELSGSWRHLETAAVLGGWAVVGLVLAPVVLRRMARRQSGATVEAGRHKAAQRIG
ncbi:MAG: ABC transporter permease [Actinomycetota bacterium]|nr:ABC transporter permease [Actinomycetota bacterium]